MLLSRRLREATPIWVPLRGPQTQALNTDADFLFYGGQAGGGKTDLLIGLALTQHHRSIIYRREAKQLEAIKDRATEILGTREGLNTQSGIWRMKNRQVEFGGVQLSGDEYSYQGRPHDLKGFDEITHFLESQFRFLCGWNRSTRPGQRCRVVCTGNPPTDSDGEWVIRFWAPWLDDGYPDPAVPGEVRWFARMGDEDIEVEGPEPITHHGEVVLPKSRTFIPAEVDDNPFLANTGYKATLQALPEPLRSQMLHGDFSAGKDDDPWQVIPTEWIKQAQERWTRTTELPMSTMGVDVARGGRDETILSPRHGTWFAEQIAVPGKNTPDGPAVSALVVQNLRDAATIMIDVVGVGASPYDHMKGAKLDIVGISSAEKSHETDRTGKLGFMNKRSELWWKFREALDPVHGTEIALPPGRKLLADLSTPRWRLLGGGKIMVETKEEIIKRLGRSPDRGDAAVYAMEEPGVKVIDDVDYTPDHWMSA